MRKEKISFKHKGKTFSLEVTKVGFLKKGFGLMFSRREKAKALLFEFNKKVNFHLTSLFVFFPFIVIWLDDKNNVLDLRKIKPFKFHIPSKKGFYKIIEIPFSHSYVEIINFLVGKKSLKRN